MDNILIPIILGSDKDISFSKEIKDELYKFGINSIVRIASAHKSIDNLIKIIHSYENNTSIPIIITCAGKSNALSGVVDSKISKPVIACPPIRNDNMYDLYSSISMPSDVCPLFILNPKNVALSVAKICGLLNHNIKIRVNEIHKNNELKLIINDIQSKYSDDNLDYDLLNICIENTKEIYDSSEYTFIKNGKIKDIYLNKNSNQYTMVTSDRLSSFDRVITTIPMKGIVLNKVSEWWFDMTQDIVPNHMLKSDNRDMIVKRTDVFQIEFIMRGYLTGSTNTSIWKNYEKGSRYYCGNILEDGMVHNQKLSRALLTPTTKGEVDELISKEDIINKKIMTLEEWDICAKYSHKLFEYGQKIASEKGLILVDTKYEFGKDIEGNIILVDELHTPDSSRYWIKYNYQERFDHELNPDMIDKEFIRKWIKSVYDDPYNAKEIIVSDIMRLKTANRYLQLYELITGNEL